MRFIGITGGVGAGKTCILHYLAEKENVKILLADEIAHMLMQPGTSCYRALREQFFGEDIFCADGSFDRDRLAKVIFSDDGKRSRLNAVVHPAVKEYVMRLAEEERENGITEYLFFEAALLIEEKFDTICDELWYIYANEDIRRIRLAESRGYSKERMDSIFASQLPEEEFRSHCRVVIDNNGIPAEAYEQIENALRRKADE